MKWYLLSPSHQMQVCRAIHMIQHSTVVTMGPFGILNFETATDVSEI